jgi:hypothetical protein
MIAPTSSGSGEPLAVIMDFGSACRARIEIKSRREAIIQQVSFCAEAWHEAEG